MFNNGIIYLLQPAELVGTNRYKIGCSKLNTLNRCCDGYKNKTRYLCIMECNDPFFLESIIKQKLKEQYILVAGNEYFSINENILFNQEDENLLIKFFFDNVYNYKLNPLYSYNFSNGIIKTETNYYDISNTNYINYNDNFYIILNYIFTNNIDDLKKFIKKNILFNYLLESNFITEINNINIFEHIDYINIESNVESSNKNIIEYKLNDNMNNIDLEYKIIRVLDYLFNNKYEINYKSFNFNSSLNNILEYENNRVEICEKNYVSYNDILKYSEISKIIIINKEDKNGFYSFDNKIYHKLNISKNNKNPLKELILNYYNLILNNKYNDINKNKKYLFKSNKKYTINNKDLNYTITNILKFCYKEDINKYKLYQDKNNLEKFIVIDDNDSLNLDNYNIIDNKTVDGMFDTDLDLIKWFKNNYRKTSNKFDFTTLKEIYSDFRDGDIYKDLSKKERKKYNKSYLVNYFKEHRTFKKYYSNRKHNYRNVILYWIKRTNILNN